MNSLLLFLIYASAIIIAIISWKLSQLPYPVWFYLPAIIRRFTYPTLPNQKVVWLENVLAADSPQVSSLDKESDQRPNILLIIADDLGVNDLNGGANVATPNINSIRQNGIDFTRGYSGHATCAPSRAAIMTGRYATRFGFEFTPAPKQLAMVFKKSEHSIHPTVFHDEELKNIPLMKEMVLPKEETMLSEVLAESGYHNYYLGKWHLGETDGYRPLERGFHESLSFLKGASLYLPSSHKDLVNADIGIALDDFLTFNLEFGVSHNNGPYFEPDIYMTDYLSREASTAIRAHVNTFNQGSEHKPFFMTLAYNAPHDPFQALRSDYESPELQHISDHTARVYAAMLKALDRGVGQVLGTLRDVEELDNTLVIFTSDNGAASYLGLKESNKPYRGGKATLFEGGIRVPFFMQWSNRLGQGLKYKKPVGHVDIFATASAVALRGVESSRQLDGQNLIPYLDELKSSTESGLPLSPAEPHESLFWRSGHYRAIVSGNWKLQITSRPQKVWLYDLGSDPFELNNLAEVNMSEDTIDAPSTSSALYFPSFGSEQMNIHSVNLKNMASESKDIRNVSFSTPTSKHELHSIIHHLMNTLIAIDKEQAQPLWPSLVEIPVTIDKSMKEHTELSDEFIYWAN